jgi:hypothetical protein
MRKHFGVSPKRIRIFFAKKEFLFPVFSSEGSGLLLIPNDVIKPLFRKAVDGIFMKFPNGLVPLVIFSGEVLNRYQVGMEEITCNQDFSQAWLQPFAINRFSGIPLSCWKESGCIPHPERF